MTTLFYSHPDCRLHDMGEGHPECPQRLDAISDHLLATGLDIMLQHEDAPLATLEQLQRAHSAGYVLQLRDLLEQVRDGGEPRALDPDNEQALTGLDDAVAIDAWWRERGVGVVVVKLGGDGCFADGAVRPVPAAA